MNCKRILAFVLALMLVLGLCACGGAPVETPEESTPAAPEQTEEATEKQTEEATEELSATPVYTVKIVDEAGNPVVGAMVQICQGETCMPGPLSGSDGTVTFQVEEADYKVSFLGGVPGGYEYSTEETEFYFEDGSYEVTIVLKAVA